MKRETDDTIGMDYIPESREVIETLANKYVRIYKESELAIQEQDEEADPTPQVAHYLESIDALVCSNPDRTFRVCHYLAHCIIDAADPNITKNPQSEIEITYADPDSPQAFEIFGQLFLSSVLHNDCDQATVNFEELYNADDDELSEVGCFLALFLALAAHKEDFEVISKTDEG